MHPLTELALFDDEQPPVRPVGAEEIVEAVPDDLADGYAPKDTDS